MKKSILMSMLLIFSITLGLTSCIPKSKKQEEKKETVNTELTVAKAVLGDFVVVPAEAQGGSLVAEHVISTDRQWMFVNEGGDYVWFECEVIFKDYLNDAASTGEIAQVRDVFQKVTDKDKGYDVHVFYATTNKDGTVYQKMDGFYLENNPINDEPISLTFKDAYDKLMTANCPKPASKYCVLRKPVWKDQTNALYIFGNPKEGMVCVDAVTGETYALFGTPLGEWP